MVRREAIEAAGLLDEGYFMYAEEVDWCWRMQRAGWPFFCVPSRAGDPPRRREHKPVSQPIVPQPVAEPAQALRPFLRPGQAPCRGRDRARWACGRRRDGQAAARQRGEIDAAEERERIETAKAVRRLFAQGETT